jgi:hypothetical protein
MGKLLLLALAPVLLSCQDGVLTAKDAATTTAVTTGQYNGTYTLTRVDCFTTGGAGPVSRSSTFISASTSTLIVNDSSFTRTFADSCTLTESASFSFDGTNRYTLASRTYVSSNGGNCAVNYELSGSAGLWTTSGSALTNLPDVSSYAYAGTNYIALRDHALSNGAGWCYHYYTK